MPLLALSGFVSTPLESPILPQLCKKLTKQGNSSYHKNRRFIVRFFCLYEKHCLILGKPKDKSMKKITVTLSDKAEKYFNEVAYSLDYGDGKVATQSQVINHCLEELHQFEEKTKQDVTGYLRDSN